MSYLDVPRLHFFGTFQANPSTLNNTPSNYTLSPSPISQVGSQGGTNWNPDGSHSWNLVCTVQTVIGPDGSSLQGDPLVNTPVSSAATPSANPQCNEPSTPKLVDLDTEQQLVSTIFGLQIQIGDSSSGTVTGNFLPQPFMDLYQIAGGGGYYQSVLQDLTWSQSPNSSVLRDLQSISPTALSIKFNLLANVTDFPGGQAQPGSITGTIGPVSSVPNFPPEPDSFLLGRLMRPTVTASGSPTGHVLGPLSDTPPFNYAPFVVNGNRGKVIVDFGNSLPMKFPTSANTPQPYDSLGAMEVAIVPSQGPPQILGTVGYTAAAYQATAMIQEFPVSPEQVSLLKDSILAVLLHRLLQTTPSQILAEDENATYLGVTPMVCRLDPGDSVQINLVAFSFGSPAANQPIDIVMNNTQLQPPVSGPPIPVGTPASALQFSPTSVTTDAKGQASFTLTAAPEGPGNPRGTINGQKSYLDGQVYGIGLNWALQPNPDIWVFVSVHVYDLVSVPESPDWQTDVLPILLPYDELYPYMANLINLSSEEVVLQTPNLQHIQMRLQLPETDPRYMPVTRDLSTNKRQIVLKWLAQPAPSNQGGGGQGGTTGG